MARLIEGKTFYKKPWYNSYRSMMDRCYRKNAKNYSNYGGRGIEVCEEWHDVENFEKWVLESNYQEGLTLDRIDVNGNYEPINCKWSTIKEQVNNKRNTKFIEYNGETHTLTEWSEITGINRSTLNNRYWRGERGEELFRTSESCKDKTWVLIDGKRRWK